MWKVIQIVCLVISDVISIVTNINMRPSSDQRNFYVFHFISKFWKNGQLKEIRNDILFNQNKPKQRQHNNTIKNLHNNVTTHLHSLSESKTKVLFHISSFIHKFSLNWNFHFEKVSNFFNLLHVLSTFFNLLHVINRWRKVQAFNCDLELSYKIFLGSIMT